MFTAVCGNPYRTILVGAALIQLFVCGLFILESPHFRFIASLSASNANESAPGTRDAAQKAHSLIQARSSTGDNDGLLRVRSGATALPTAYHVHVLMQKGPKRSRGELLRIHRPFAIGSQKKTISEQDLLRRLRCTDFSKTVEVSSKTCLDLLAPQEVEYVESSYRKVASLELSGDLKKPTCHKGSALIFPLHWRDRNVCHTLMKFLFGFSVVKRALETPHWLNIPPIQTVIILARRKDISIFRNRNSFHVGLMKALFTRHGVKVVVRRSFASLDAKYKCFAAGVFALSYSNRFAHPDALLGENSTYYGDGAPLPFPLSSDGLSLREHVFKSKSIPRRKFKVVYVARQPGKRRTWTRSGEHKMRYMLRRVCQRHGAELDIFEGDASSGFMSQVQHFADASVIIGFHGAGLALAVLAPRGTRVIEIEPEYHFLNLFGRLESSGLLHQVIRLSKGSSNSSSVTSSLMGEDEKKIELALDTSLRSIF